MKYILRFNIFVVLVMVASTLVSAQQLDMELLQGMEPRNIGPAGMSGRITAIDVVVEDTKIIYAGSASGGIWKSVSGGVTWEPIFDDYGAASIGALDIHQKNPSIIWVGTGEGNPRNSQSSGAGVYKSLDAGRTWELMGLEGTRNIHRVIIHPDDPNTVFVGAQGSAWGSSEDRGVYKTTDGGETWEKILYIDENTGVGEMVMDPSNPNKIFVNMWQFSRSAWFFTSGGPSSGLYMTLDGGDTWTELTDEDGLPEGDLGRMGLAIAASNPNVVYALIESENNAIYRSTDGGYTWHMRQQVSRDGDVGNRPFYYAEIYVDPTNENRVYSIYTYMSKSEDGGRTFDQISSPVGYNWVHPDHHAFWIHPEHGKTIIDGNDGGLNISYDGGETFWFMDNIPVGQFYHVAVDMDMPYNVYGGMQDNGSWGGPAYLWRSAGGIRNSYWEELYFGDGFDVMIDPDNPGYAYAMSQQGNIGRVNLETGTSRFVQPTHPEGERLRFNWNSPVTFDPFDKSTIYFGSQFVHRSSDDGQNWEIISPDLTTNDTTKQKQHISGGLTTDATGAENHTTLLAIEVSSTEEGVIWAGSDDGRLHVTRDNGETWTDVSGNLRGVPEGSWIAQIKASTFNNGEAFAVINDYRRDNWTPYIMHTTDYGRRWTNIVDDKGLEGYSLSFVQDLVEPNLMFVGTEFGLYVSVDGGDNWAKWTNGYPTVSTYDMVIHPREHDLVIGTFGRSFWVLDDIRPLREVAASGVDELTKTIKAFEVPDAYMVGTRQGRGIRFAADAVFSGDNRPIGAMISYSVNKETVKVEEREGPGGGPGGGGPPAGFNPGAGMQFPFGNGMGGRNNEPRVEIAIIDADGDTVNTIQDTPDESGINRTFWRFNTQGVPQPRRSSGGPGGGGFFGGGGGAQAAPGTYKLVLTYGEDKDSTEVTIHPDPRIEFSMDALERTNEFREKTDELTKRLTVVVDNLKDAKSIVEVNEELAGADDRSRMELRSVNMANRQTKEKIESLLDKVFGEEIEGQGIIRNPAMTVMTRLQGPRRYLNNDFDGPGENEENLYRLAKEAVDGIVDEINTFFDNDWPEYQSTIEEANLTPFKTFEKGE